MNDAQHHPWPEIDIPQGWKKNPRAGTRLTRILLLTLAAALAVTALSAGRSEVLPVICFLAILALPVAGPAAARIGCGTNSRETRELHMLTERELTLEPADGGCRLLRYRGPYQKLHIPDDIQGMPVTQAAKGLLRGNRIIAYVHLPASLQSIPEEMFMGCDNLPAIVLPPQVKSIGPRAFAGCLELKDVYIPASVAEISPDAFADCQQPILHVRAGSCAEHFAKENNMLWSHR